MNMPLQILKFLKVKVVVLARLPFKNVGGSKILFLRK